MAEETPSVVAASIANAVPMKHGWECYCASSVDVVAAMDVFLFVVWVSVPVLCLSVNCHLGPVFPQQINHPLI